MFVQMSLHVCTALRPMVPRVLQEETGVAGSLQVKYRAGADEIKGLIHLHVRITLKRGFVSPLHQEDQRHENEAGPR